MQTTSDKYIPPSPLQKQSRANCHRRKKQIRIITNSHDNHGRKQRRAQETLSGEASPGPPWQEEDKTQHRCRSSSMHRCRSSSIDIFRSNPSGYCYFRSDAGILRERSIRDSTMPLKSLIFDRSLCPSTVTHISPIGCPIIWHSCPRASYLLCTYHRAF